MNRSRQIAAALTRHGLGWLVVEMGLGQLVPFERGWFGHPKRDAPYSSAEHLRIALGELGATFIKLGQVLSTRADLLPPQYIAQLAQLQDAAPAVPFEQICQIIYAELGQSPQALFAEFDPQPLASASIGQAHLGRLKDGQEIVVKVQRPGVAQQVEQDLSLLAGIAEWAETHSAFGRNYSLSALVEEFSYTLHSELNYQSEGKNAERFRRNFADEAAVYIPRIYWEFTTERVLSIERVSGIKIADTSALDKAGIDRRTVAENAVRIMLREAFEFGFFHADPHPGNFFVQPDATIGLIDFGMVGRLDQRMQDALLRIGLAVVKQDAVRLTDELHELGVVRGRINRAGLQRDLDRFLGQYAGQSIKDLVAGQMTSEVMAIAFHHHLHLPGELVIFLKVVAMSEGLGAQLDPTFKLFEFAAPYLQLFWLERHSPKTMALRLAQASVEWVDLGLDLPHRAARLLTQIERGELEFSVNHEGLHKFAQQMQHMTNRLSLSIILAATIVALGLLMLVYHPDGWEQYGGWLFLIAFLGSLAFGIWLMWTILRSGRHS